VRKISWIDLGKAVVEPLKDDVVKKFIGGRILALGFYVVRFQQM